MLHWNAAHIDGSKDWCIVGGEPPIRRSGGWVNGHLMMRVANRNLSQDRIDFPETYRDCPPGYVWIPLSSLHPKWTLQEVQMVPR